MFVTIGEKMQSNIGEKVMRLGQIIVFLGIIASVVSAMFVWSTSEYVLGFFILLGGSLVSWVISLILYSFGRFSQETPAIKKNETQLKKESAY